MEKLKNDKVCAKMETLKKKKKIKSIIKSSLQLKSYPSELKK